MRTLLVQVLSAASAGSSVVELASGSDHLLARTAEGSVWSWGCGERGRLGRLHKEHTEGRKDDGAHAGKLLAPGKVDPC
jgi:regulator of chromosome condensation